MQRRESISKQCGCTVIRKGTFFVSGSRDYPLPPVAFAQVDCPMEPANVSAKFAVEDGPLPEVRSLESHPPNACAR